MKGEPGEEAIDDVVLLGGVQGEAFGDGMPFAEAGAAAAGGGVLCDEDGVAAHGRLFAVVGGMGGGEPGADEVFGVAADGVGAFFEKVGAVAGAETEAAAEGGLRQTGEEGVEGWRGIGHGGDGRRAGKGWQAEKGESQKWWKEVCFREFFNNLSRWEGMEDFAFGRWGDGGRMEKR